MTDIENANVAVGMSIQHLVNCAYQAGAASCGGLILMALAIKENYGVTKDVAKFELQTDLMVAQGRLIAASLLCDESEVSFTAEININRARKLVTEVLESLHD